jgi:hypothetical protein
MRYHALPQGTQTGKTIRGLPLVQSTVKYTARSGSSMVSLGNRCRLPSAVNLKFLSLLAASSFRNFKFKTALES